MLLQILSSLQKLWNLVSHKVDGQTGNDGSSILDLLRTRIQLREAVLNGSQVLAHGYLALRGGNHQDVEDLGYRLVGCRVSLEQGEADQEACKGLVELQRYLGILGHRLARYFSIVAVELFEEV